MGLKRRKRKSRAGPRRPLTPRVRAVPRDPHYYWQRETDGVRDFLAGVAALEVIHGNRWVERMRRHYRRRLEYLIANEPKRG